MVKSKVKKVEKGKEGEEKRSTYVLLKKVLIPILVFGFAIYAFYLRHLTAGKYFQTRIHSTILRSTS